MNRREALRYTSLILGYTVSGVTVSAVLNGCAPDTSEGWTPNFFDKDQFTTIRAMVHQILPPTDTPGALDVMADRFVDQAILDNLKPEEKEQLLKELTEFEADAQSTYGKAYGDCSDEEQIALLKKWADKSKQEWDAAYAAFEPRKANNYPRASAPDPGRPMKPLFKQIQELALTGYFVSEEIGENVLSYDPIPGGYE
ncbi:MAG: gluconate 2-dehydrogenase subunit 3 family protein, partial [Phaeodactylibacter sp.]|nr:gluconate 2-dehydrogenase subunit 3 family protein [Phaeodactylibacter sp.]